MKITKDQLKELQKDRKLTIVRPSPECDRDLREGPTKILDWGMELRFWIQGIPIVAVGNANKITRRGLKLGIRKDAEAEAFVRHVRATTYSLIQRLRSEQPGFGEIHFPLMGAECPIRVDMLIGYCKADEQKLYRQDLDNLAKGIFDGLKYGEISEGLSFGIIDDDRYITESLLVKGLGPDDEEQSRILIKVSRAGFRDAKGLGFMMQVGPFPPWVPAIQQPNLIISPAGVKLPPRRNSH